MEFFMHVLAKLLFVSHNFYPVASLSVPSPPPTYQTCRSVPGSVHWPSHADWSSLNQSLHGHLLAPNPPAIVCDPSRKETYDKSACAAVGKQWSDPLFHTNDPVSVQYPDFQNDACLPTALYNKSTNCRTRAFPKYVVDASKAEHVAEALQFANRKGVRVSVKGTGHDFLGRSAGRGMAIWTHNIRGIDVLPSFKPTACEHCSAISAIRIFAGEVFDPVYKVAEKHGVIPVIGADGTVGLGGYVLGGGHSPISTKFGLAVDHVLEMKAVTPAGEIVTANQHQHQDLFWALRGGGGSSFGILISATLKTFPTFPVSAFSVEIASTKKEARENNNTNFYSALADFHTLVPRMTENNLTGYNFAGPSALFSGKPTTDPEVLLNGPQSFFHSGYGLDRTQAATREALRPLWQKLNATKGIISTVKVHPQKGVYSQVGGGSGDGGSSTTSSYGGAGVNLIMGSRLWDRNALTDKKKFISTIRKMQPVVLSGLMISGPGVRNAAHADDVSVTPAWRRTYYHITTGAQWAYRNQSAKAEGIKLNNFLTKALRDHAPDMGCYMNEANGMEPNFQQAFWGSNYGRLLKLKHKFDPQGVLYCTACVGSEEWELKPDGELCRKS